jgi:hypothetical protein
LRFDHTKDTRTERKTKYIKTKSDIFSVIRASSAHRAQIAPSRVQKKIKLRDLSADSSQL